MPNGKNTEGPVARVEGNPLTQGRKLTKEIPVRKDNPFRFACCSRSENDGILPGQGGMDLILELHAKFPNLAIILTSGKIDMSKSTFKVLAHQFGVLSILPKPFTVEELIDTVNETLQGEKAPV